MVSEFYYSMLTEPICSEYIQLTKYGQTVKMLLRDINVNKVYMYMPFKSDFIIDQLIELLGGTYGKLEFIYGINNRMLKESKIDQYTFENVNDVDAFLEDLTHRKEIIIPEYSYNFSIQEQDGIEYRRLNLNHPNEFYDKNNTTISIMNVPI